MKAFAGKTKRHEYDGEADLLFQIRAKGLPAPHSQYKAVPGSRCRWDFAYPDAKLLIEVNGGIWVKSGHSTGTGLQRDYNKNNSAVLAEFKTLQFSSDDVKSGRAIKTLEEALNLFLPSQVAPSHNKKL